MSDSFFLDTNIFVYSFFNQDPGKQRQAKDLIRLALDGKGSISWQIEQEFSNVGLHKCEKPMGKDDLKEYLDTVLLPLCTVWPEESIYREALIAGLETGYHWYDNLILVAAVKSKSRILYSEDLQHSRVYRGVHIVKPFSG